MRIGSVASFGFQQQDQIHQSNLAKLQEQLATGKKINRASDDAAGLAISQVLDQYVRGYQTASENINAGMSAMQISDGGSSATMDMLQRQRDLALESSNGTLNPDERQALNQEYQQISQQIQQTSQSTNFNGQALSNGQGPLADGTGKILVGNNASDTETIPGSDLTLASLGLSATGIGTADGANQALSAIDKAMGKVSSDQATRGSFQNRLEFADANNQSQVVNGTQALSSILDTDTAQTTTDMVRESLLSDTQTAAIAQFNNLSRTHLLALLAG